jgi:PilZ domain
MNRLPSAGILLTGALRDLSLHGCCVDTPLPIDCGARAEIVVRVNAASFRAVGEVRAIRGRSGAALEFVRLSARGKDSLSGLVTDLARLQAIMDKLKSVRREMDEKAFRQELEQGKLQAETLSARFPFLGITPKAETVGRAIWRLRLKQIRMPKPRRLWSP